MCLPDTQLFYGRALVFSFFLFFFLSLSVSGFPGMQHPQLVIFKPSAAEVSLHTATH